MHVYIYKKKRNAEEIKPIQDVASACINSFMTEVQSKSLTE